MDSPLETAIRKPFADHIKELRRRLIICVFFLALGSGAGYAINQKLIQVIQHPLNQKLYYTSPTGGFNFIFVLCLSFGILVALPCIVYQILAFLRPVLPAAYSSMQFWYPFFSTILAAGGVCFAYFISLPAALHFLTSIGGDANIQSLISTDTYFKFALAYLIGFAVLFQLPLLLIIANRITPLKPRKLMKAQRYVVLISFIIAAVLTPTPDPFNQGLMAAPIIVLYQLSIIMIWLKGLRRPKRKKITPLQPAQQPVAEPEFIDDPEEEPEELAPMPTPALPVLAPRPTAMDIRKPASEPLRHPAPIRRPRVVMDISPAQRRPIQHQATPPQS